MDLQARLPNGVMLGIVVGHPCHGLDDTVYRFRIDLDGCFGVAGIGDHGMPVRVMAIQ